MKRIRLIVWTVVFLLACADRNAAGGSSVETENALSVLILDSAGDVVSGAIARVRPMWYVANGTEDSTANAPSWLLTSDERGRVRLDGLPDGYYGVEISGNGRSVFFAFGIADTVVSRLKDTVVLAALGGIKGSVSLPAGAKFAWIQVFGLDRVAKTDANGYFALDSLPSGELHIRVVAESLSEAIADARLDVKPGVIASVGELPKATLETEEIFTWRFSRKVAVSSMLSSWMLPIQESALGIIRLDSTLFSFDEALGTGNDIRITDEYGVPLAFDLALWDSLHRQSVVRVRIDGLALEDSLMLYWGRSGALSASTKAIWSGISDSSRLEWSSLEVEDFEEINLRSNLPDPISPHYWYLFPQDSNVQIVPTLDSAVQGIQPADSGRIGNAFHLRTISNSGRWGLLGLNLDTIPKNLAHLDSIVFWVRGSGQYILGLESLVSDGGKAVYFDSLDGAWTRKCVRPQDFVPGDSIGGNTGWDAIKSQITNLSFFAVGNADFWLDDIRIFGWNRDDLK